MAAIVTVATSSVVSAQEKKLRVLIWGVTWQSAIEAVSKKYEAKTGVKVEYMTQSSSGEGLVKLQAMKDRPTVDVWFTTASVAARATTDTALFAPLPADKMSKLKELLPGAATEGYVAVYSYPMSIIYRPDLVKGTISSWSELWEPRFAHKLAVPAMGMYQGRMLMVASHLDGGDKPDVERGFQRLQSLKPNVAIFYGSDAQARQALAQGEVGVLVAPPSQAKRVADAGREVRIVSPKPAPMNFDVAAIVRAGQEDLAADYVNFLLEKENNEYIAQHLNMGAVNTSAAQPRELVEAMPKPGDELVLDEGYINEHIAGWVDRFNREIAR